MTNVYLNFKDVRSLSNAPAALALFTTAAEQFDLDEFTSDGITESRRILDLADKVERESWAAKQRKPHDKITRALIAGDLDPAQAVTLANDAEHQAKMNTGQHTPAGRVALNLRMSALRPLKGQDETAILDWLTPALDQAVADASAHADTIDHIIGAEPRRDPPGVRTVEHHWQPRQNALRRNRRLARAWEDLATALADVYRIAGTVHELRAHGIIRAPLTDTRTTVWSQVWETIPQGAFAADTPPGRVREFYRAHRHQHTLALATAKQLDNQAGEMPDNHEQIEESIIAMHRRFESVG